MKFVTLLLQNYRLIFLTGSYISISLIVMNRSIPLSQYLFSFIFIFFYLFIYQMCESLLQN